MISQQSTLTDGVILLRCLEQGDTQSHLAGEDADQVRWASGGTSTAETVARWIAENRREWLTGGPRRNFGVFDAETDELAGNAEAHLALDGLAAGEVNLSYVTFPTHRGRGIATRTVISSSAAGCPKLSGAWSRTQRSRSNSAAADWEYFGSARR
ncbi:MAG TPA: GNAT family N-acetyltransferase [Mycobacteriales bacterium]|nr:GNAT family N-acetyltransferase [Mycobacteriales bacterium]